MSRPPARNAFRELPNGDVAIIIDSPTYGLHEFIVDSAGWRVAQHFTWSINVSDKLVYARAGWAQDGERHTVQLHVLLMSAELADGLVVDHRSRITTDCRRSNLRMATRRQSSLNRSGWGDPSVPRGVRRLKNGKFRAQFSLGGKTHHGPVRLTSDEAGADYNDMARGLLSVEDLEFFQANELAAVSA